MMSSRYYILGVIMVAVLAFFSACENETVIERNLPSTPFNPYDTIDFSSNVMPEPVIDSASFLGLHTFIFSKSCALPACHDGSFEPDLRTVQSAYNTLVLHPVIKNTIDEAFEHRVVPNNSQQSWLYERLITDDLTIGRMPLYDSLSPDKVALVKEWIDNGAPDIFGNLPSQPDYLPRLYDVVAYLPDNGNMRVDTMRLNGNPLFPIILPANSNVEMWFIMYDVNEDEEFPSAGYFVPPTAFTTNQIRFSANEPVDFSNAQQFPLIKDLVPTTHNTRLGPGIPIWHHITFNTSNFNVGDINYFRVLVNDGAQPQAFEMPDAGYPIYLQSFFSFIVQ